MSEPLARPAPFVVPADPGERLAFEAAVLADRLAELLRRALPDAEGPLAAGRAFVERAAAAAGELGGEPSPVGWQEGALDRTPETPQPLDRLAGSLALSPFEVDLVLLAGLAEEHEGFSDLFALLHPQGHPWPTVGLAARLFCPSDADRRAARRVIESGPARAAGVFRLAGDGPFFTRHLVLADALWTVLGGVDAWPEGIRPECVGPAAAGLDGWLDAPAPRRAREALVAGGPVTVLVTADDPEAGFARAQALAAAAGAEPLAFRLPAGAETGRLILPHVLARGAVPVLLPAEPDGPGPAALPSLAAHPGPAVVCGRAGGIAIAGPRPIVAVSCDRLGPGALGRMWAQALPGLAEEATLLAARYPLEPAAAREVARDLAHLESLTGRPGGLDEVAASVRARSGAAVGGSVRLRRPTAGWEDLVLPEPRLAQLREMVDRLLLQARVLDDWRFLAGRPGARGVRTLFAGPPGTGKTLAAEVMAGALAVDLLVVDLSRVVSKWIGETEKNLAEVFEAAERSRTVLLFDEADALFGKRTEVSDAHDRYANLETAYLLARLERFGGLAILSTNLRQNLDPAFSRRLEFILDFEPPGRAERLALWRCHLPAEAPLAEDVDLAELAATFPVVGGLIRNAAVAAAFLAAAEDRPIGRKHLIHAVRREYEKSGKAFPGLPRNES